MISVIIPAFNEEGAIGKTIDGIKKVINENSILQGSEIIVINDGSTDNTKNEALEKDVIVLDNIQNVGYGYSLKKGIKNAKNETIVIIDADMSYPFSRIIDMLKEKQKGFDLVVGARTGKNYKELYLKVYLEEC